MPACNALPLKQKWHSPARSLIFFAGFYLLIWWVVEPHLVYYSFGVSMPYPVFYGGWEFMERFLHYPGGVVEYGAAFLSQGYYYSWLGALLFTAIAWAICRAFGCYLSIAGARQNAFIRFLPALALLTIQCRYTNPLYLSLALLTSLGASVIYLKILPENHVRRAALFFLIFVSLYHIAGGAVVLFAVLAILNENYNRRGAITGMIFLVAAVFIVWFQGVYISDMSWTNAFTGVSLSEDYGFLTKIKWQLIACLPHLPLDPKMKMVSRIAAQGLYIFVPMAVAAGCFWQWFKQRPRFSVKHSKKSECNKIKPQIARWTLVTSVLMVLMLIAAYASLDSNRKKLFQIGLHASRGNWQEVLDLASEIPPQSYGYPVNHDINRALFDKRQLGDRMFEYPQKIESLLLLDKEKPNSKTFFKRSRLFLEMGHTARAEKTAHEILESTGDHPAVIEMLAKINLLKGKTETAKVFLRALSRNLVEGDRGRKLLEMMRKDPEMTESEEMQKLRRNSPQIDEASLKFDADKFFGRLLEQNRHNRLAFEYMMAYYLLSCQVDKIAANIHRLDDFGYKRLPRYYEEAMVIYMGPKGDRADFPQRWRPGSQARQKAIAFDKIESLYTREPKKAMQALAKGYGDSYYYYYMFKVSGVKR